MLLALQLNNLLETPAAIPPVFSGTIPNISRTLDTGTHTYDLGAYFSGADSYAIAPSVEAGWTFDTGTGELVIDTDEIGSFGPFTITATNANGDTDSNAFSVEVVAAAVEPVGGHYWPSEKDLKKKRKNYREQRDREQEAERQELRRLLEEASGLVEQVEEQEETEISARFAEIKTELRSIETRLERKPSRVDTKALQMALDMAFDRFLDSVVMRLEALIEEIRQEIAEDLEG